MKEGQFDFIVCGTGWSDLSINEVAQNLRMKFRGTPLLLAAPENQFQNKEQLIKNGIQDFFIEVIHHVNFAHTVHTFFCSFSRLKNGAWNCSLHRWKVQVMELALI